MMLRKLGGARRLPPVGEAADAVPRSAYPTGSPIRRALVTLRDEGPKSFWFKVLSECGYRRLLLLERALDQPIADFTPALPVDVAMLAESEIDDYLAFRASTAREIADRLRSGQMCFVARHEGRIVATAWVAVHPVWVPFLGCQIEMAAGDAHIYDKYTLPAYRGQGISNAVRTYHLGICSARVIVVPPARSFRRMRHRCATIRRAGFAPTAYSAVSEWGPGSGFSRCHLRAAVADGGRLPGRPPCAVFAASPGRIRIDR